MIKIYNKMKTIPLIIYSIFGIIGFWILVLLLYLLFLNRIIALSELVNIFALATLISLIVPFVSSKIMGYSLCDEGVAVGKVSSNGFLQQIYVKWKMPSVSNINHLI